MFMQVLVGMDACIKSPKNKSNLIREGDPGFPCNCGGSFCLSNPVRHMPCRVELSWCVCPMHCTLKKQPSCLRGQTTTFFFCGFHSEGPFRKIRSKFFYFIGFVCRTETMHRFLLSCSCKFPNYFAFTLGCYLLMLFLV